MDDSDYDPEVEEVQDGIDRPVSENNPIRMAERNSIFPSFLNTPGKSDSRQNDRNNLAKKDLKNSEKNAAGAKKDDQKKDGSPVNKVRNLEKNATPAGVIANKVMGKDKGGKNEGKVKGLLKKKGAAIFLTLLIGGGAVGAGVAGQGLQGFSLVNNIIQNNNLAGSALKARVRTATYSMLSRKTAPTAETKNVYKQTGLDLNTDDNGLVKSISYEGSDGTVKTITNTEELNVAFESDSIFDSKITKTADILDIEANYGKVRETASDRIGLNRSRFNDYDAEGADHSKGLGFQDLAADPNAKTTMQSGGYVDKDTGEPTDADSDNGEVKYGDEAEVKGTDYDDTIDQVVKMDESDVDGNTKMTSDTLKMDSDFEGAVEKAKGKLSVLSAAACAYSTIAQGIAVFTIAKQMIDMINLASGFMEGTQRCQAGDGTCSSMKKYLEIFTTGDFWQAISIQSLFGAPGASSQSAGVANLENVFNNKGIGMALERNGISRASWQSCTYSKLVSNGISFASDIVSIFTGGLFSIFKKVIKTVVISAVITVAIGTAIKGVISLASKALHFDVIQDMSSKLSGEYVPAGGGLIFDSMGKADGLAGGTALAVANFYNYHDSVIASRALYDRENLSPFDISSPYTFLGSLVESMVSFSVLNSAKSAPLTRLLSTTSSLVTNSVVNLLPQAAASTYDNIADEIGDCPIAETVDAVGTANHCRNYVVADTGTFDITYEDAVRYLSKAKDGDDAETQLDENGEIVPGSDLAEYVTNWTQRDTPVGLADSTVQQRYHKMETGNGLIDGALGGTPLVGDWIDMVNSEADIEHQGDIFGSKYIVGSDEWTENQQYIHAYVGLDAAYNTLGLIQESAVAKFLEKYYAENPIDYSYEGTLARFSGLQKSEVSDILAYMDYMDEVAQYDPEDRLAFAEKFERPILVDDGEKSDSDLMLPLEEIVYFDLRNKSYAV